MSGLLVAVVGAEAVLADGRRVGCSSLIVTEDEISVVVAIREWPDDRSESRLRWQLADTTRGRALTQLGGGYGGGTTKPGAPTNFDGHWRFTGAASASVQLTCGFDGRDLLDVEVPIAAAPTSAHRITIRSAHHRPPENEREHLGQVRSRWPPERAVADRIETPASTVDSSGSGMDVVAIERWGDVRTMLARFPDEERHTGREGPPVWWKLDIDGLATSAVLVSAGTGASGLLASFVLDDMPHATPRAPR